MSAQEGRTKLRLIGVVFALAAAGMVALVLNRSVEIALESGASADQPVEFVPVPERPTLPFWGSEDVESVVALPGGLYAAGAFGVARLQPPVDSKGGGLERIDISMSLPTRRASAMSSWRTDLAVGLEFEGLFVYHGGGRPPSDAAEIKRIKDAWGAWFGSLGAAVVDGGNPVGKSSTVKSDGALVDGGGEVSAAAVAGRPTPRLTRPFGCSPYKFALASER